MDVTKGIAEYIFEHHISTLQITRDTQIPEHKLKRDTNEKLTAAEFLMLCAYLNIKPEDYYG